MPLEYLYGYQCVRAALRARSRRIRQLLFYDNQRPPSPKAHEILQLARDAAIPLQYSTKNQLDALCHQRPHQNMALQVEPLVLRPVDTPDAAGGVAMLLTDVGDPQNVGSIIRSAAYLGLPRLYLTDQCAPPTPVVAKASAGSLEFYHPQVRLCRRTGAFLEAAKRDGWLILGTGAASEDQPSSVAPPDKCHHSRQRRLVVMGSEGEGLAPSILRRCDAIITIRGSPQAAPMGLDSLNVGVAAALLLQMSLRPSEGDDFAFIKGMPAGQQDV